MYTLQQMSAFTIACLIAEPDLGQLSGACRIACCCLRLHGNVYGMTHLCHICNVLAVHEHCARGGIVEPEDQSQRTGLAAAWQCIDALSVPRVVP